MATKFSAEQRLKAAEVLIDLHKRQGISYKAIAAHMYAETGIPAGAAYSALITFNAAIRKGEVYNFGVRISKKKPNTNIASMFEYLLNLNSNVPSQVVVEAKATEPLEKEYSEFKAHRDESKSLCQKHVEVVDRMWLAALRELKTKLNQEAGISFSVIQEVYEERYTEHELAAIFN